LFLVGCEVVNNFLNPDAHRRCARHDAAVKLVLNFGSFRRQLKIQERQMHRRTRPRHGTISHFRSSNSAGPDVGYSVSVRLRLSDEAREIAWHVKGGRDDILLNLLILNILSLIFKFKLSNIFRPSLQCRRLKYSLSRIAMLEIWLERPSFRSLLSCFSCCLLSTLVSIGAGELFALSLPGAVLIVLGQKTVFGARKSGDYMMQNNGKENPYEKAFVYTWREAFFVIGWILISFGASMY
jgi:hypothetical protein